MKAPIGSTLSILEEVGEHFDQWRRSKKKGERIPEPPRDRWAGRAVPATARGGPAGWGYLWSFAIAAQRHWNCFATTGRGSGCARNACHRGAYASGRPHAKPVSGCRRASFRSYCGTATPRRSR